MDELKQIAEIIAGLGEDARSAFLWWLVYKAWGETVFFVILLAFFRLVYVLVRKFGTGEWK